MTIVSEIASKVLHGCLVEDGQLFFRTFLEKLTNKDRQENLIFLLRKLLHHVLLLPAQTAHTLFNYLVRILLDTILLHRT